MKTDEELIFDDAEAVEYIWNLIPEMDIKGLTKDDIEYVLDVVYDYYESEGIMDEDVAEEALIDEEKMYEFIKREARKDGIKLDDEQIQLILDGEFEYGLSKGIYHEDDVDEDE